MKKFIFITISSTLLFLLCSNSVEASILDTSVNRIFTATPDYMLVEETKTTTVAAAGYKIPSGEYETFVIQNFIKDPLTELERLEFAKDSIQITDSSDKEVSFNIVEDNGSLMVKVPFPRDIKYGESYTFKIEYKSKDLVNKNGNLYDIYIIPFSKDYQFSNGQDNQRFSTEVRIPNTFGEINFAVPNNNVVDNGEYRSMEIATEQLIGEFGWIQIGTQQFYNFRLRLPYIESLPNVNLNNLYEITIPRDVQTGRISQKVYFESFNPEPRYIKQDVEGNMIAMFEIPTSQPGQITIDGYAELSQSKVDLVNNSGTLNDLISIDNKLIEKAPYWEVDHPDIVSKASQLNTSENIYQLVENTYLDIVNSIDYSEVDRFGLTERKGALATLRGGGAVCMEYSDLFITLMRAQGIPARAAYGHGFDSRVPVEEQVGHQWAEVYFPLLEKWVSVDVTWGESGKTMIGGDLNHLYTHVASFDPDVPPQVKSEYYGTDPISDNLKLEVNSIERIENKDGLLTQEETLEKYKTQEIELANSLIAELTQSVNYIDANVTLFILSNLTDSIETVKLIKFVIYTFPFGLIAYTAFRVVKKAGKEH